MIMHTRFEIFKVMKIHIVVISVVTPCGKTTFHRTTVSTSFLTCYNVVNKLIHIICPQ